VKVQPEIKCFIRLAWGWLYSPDPIHIKWRLNNYKSFMPILKTSPLTGSVKMWFLSNPYLTHPKYIIHQHKFVLHGLSTWDVLYMYRCILYMYRCIMYRNKFAADLSNRIRCRPDYFISCHLVFCPVDVECNLFFTLHNWGFYLFILLINQINSSLAGW